MIVPFPEEVIPLLGYLAMAAAALAGVLAVAFFAVALRARSSLPKLEKCTVGFFHPFADGGGGGERVLWYAVKAVHEASPHAKILLYVREGVSSEHLVADAEKRFNIVLNLPPGSLQVVPLSKSSLVLPERYPRFTLIGQAVGSVRLGWEALSKRVPEVFIDTTGWAFTYPLARIAGCKVATYTHYPTVSTNMIRRVWGREAGYNNQEQIAGSLPRSLAKLAYYNVFALVYGLSGGCANVVMVNSSWTRRHVAQLFWSWSPPIRVYPPCDTEELQALPLDRRLKELFLVSVAQFRPEKDHRKQLESFAGALARADQPDLPNSSLLRHARLKMIGSCRGPADEARLRDLQAYAAELGIADHVDWCVNVPFTELKSLLGEAVGGLHTMRDEHFGISVVEYMAAGAIPIAHNSAGPAEDIVIELPDGRSTGFLADTVEQYTDAITQVLLMDQRERLYIAAAAREHAASFSNQAFLDAFTAAIASILP